MIKEITILALVIFVLGLIFAPTRFNPIKQQAVNTASDLGQKTIDKIKQEAIQQIQGNLTCIENGEQVPCHYKDKDTVVIGG